MSKYNWTPEALARLFDLRASGLSFDKIGPMMGMSKNAALGMHRRQCEKRGILPPVNRRKRVLEAIEEGRSRIAPELKRDTIPKRKYTTGADRIRVSKEGIGFILPSIAPAIQQKGPAIGILDVTGCRWPLEDDPAVIGGRAFCNAPQKEGRSYCAHHCREARSTEAVKTWVRAAA